MKKRFWRILSGALIFLAALLIQPTNPRLQPLIFLISYLILAGDVLMKALRNILRGQLLDEKFLMGIASLGAFCIRQYSEGVAVMLFYQVGELFQSYAVQKSRKSIADLMDIRPDYANVQQGLELIRMDPDDVKIGDLIVIKAGEKVALDGTVREGRSMIDTSALTGESLPREVTVGDDILSGCINLHGVLTVEVKKVFGESTVSKILDLVENASSKKAKSEQFITKFARYYTPIVVTLAVLLAVLPPLLIPGASFGSWIYRSLSFLVVSCPCALVISIPLSFFGGIGGASRRGILVKGSNYLEALAQTEIVVFDKTGTLTKGVFNVQEIRPQGMTREMLLELAAYAESYSNHPISSSLKRAYGKAIQNERISGVEEIAGQGVVATVDGKQIIAGNVKLLQDKQIPYFTGELIGTVVHVAVDGIYAGYLLISDEVKEDASQAIRALKKNGIQKIIMLTGDNQNVGAKIAEELGIDQVYAELLPADKVNKLEELLRGKSGKGKLAFVGDGINDAPVLARADIGIAMGALGSDAAIEAADVVIMTDEPSKIATAIKISKKTLAIVYQNIILAISIKVIVLILSALGIVSMWAAIFADVGVMILAVLNSFRALNMRNL
ncbi:MAG: cadmium-translocating P-type ATPase [Negativicutes bacterium]|nr:cadmium-translocating P-type ATPase [Negativicutes bacterium]